MTRRRSRTATPCSCDPQLLGEIKGKQDMILDQIKSQSETIRGVDARLRTQENRGAVFGTLGGMIMAIVVQLASLRLRGGHN